MLEPVVERYRMRDLRRYFRADAAFAKLEIYEFLEAEGYLYAIRLPTNPILRESISHLLSRPVGDRRTMYRSFTPASVIRPEAGTSPAALSPRSSGIRVNSVRVSASS